MSGTPEQGKYAEAEPLYLRALRIREQQLVQEHPQLAETMHDLARLREAQGNGEAAKTLYIRALAVREQALGMHHPKRHKHAHASSPCSTHWDSMRKRPSLKQFSLSHERLACERYPKLG